VYYTADRGRHACEPIDCADNTQLGADDVGVFILQLNGHAALLEDWRFSVRRWLLFHVLYEGVSLLCILERHEQENLNSSSTCLSLRQYNSTRRRNVMSTTRLECKLCENSIRSIVSEKCCSMSCTQHFLRQAVKVVQIEMWSGDHALRKHIKLQVHRNAYKVDGRKVVFLEGHEICLNSWLIIHSVSRADIYRFKGYSTHGMRASHPGN
jgi:hypothetical protein